MANLRRLFKREGKTTTVVLGEVLQSHGNGVYTASYSGVVGKVFSSNLSTKFNPGNQVVLNKSESGKVFIMGKTGIMGQYNSTRKEVFVNG